MKQRWKHRVALFLLICALNLVLAFLFVSPEYILAQGPPLAQARRLPYGRALFQEFLYWCMWEALLPVMAILARRVPVFLIGVTGATGVVGAGSARPLPRLLGSILAHGGFAVGIALALQAAYFVLLCPMHLALGEACAVRKRFVANLGGIFTTYTFTVYFVVLFAVQAYQYLRHLQEERLSHAEAQKALIAAQLQALRAQIHPHFLFNTLNAISALVYSDARAADRMIARLSELLRYCLSLSDKEQIRLQEEIDFVLGYLEIEGARLGDRLRMEFVVPEPLCQALVPPLLLQPLVENAIRHGISRRTLRQGPGHLQIRGWQQGAMLILSVTDDGPGFSMDCGQGGLGLANVRERLRLLSGTLDLRTPWPQGADGGVCVELRLPLVFEPALGGNS